MKKRVLFLIPSLEHGGAERVLVNLVNLMDKSKYEVTVQTLFDRGINKQLLSDTVRYIPGMRKQIKGYSHLQKLFTPRFLYRMIIREQYDIVVSFLEGVTSRIVSGCPETNTKKVAWVHTTWETRELSCVGFRNYREALACMNRYDRIACVAESVKVSVTEQLSTDVPIDVLYNVNQTEFIRQRANEPMDDERFDTSCFTVCSAGKLTDVKGFDRLLKVHKQLLEQGTVHKVYILGCGERERMLRECIREYGLEKSFVLLGFCENPYKYVQRCDLYVCSSYREGFSTAVTEALILGVPVVSTDCSGAKELLGAQDEYGIVVQNSESGIYEGMWRMLNDSALVERYKEKACERGRSFDPAVTVSAVERMLENL